MLIKMIYDLNDLKQNLQEQTAFKETVSERSMKYEWSVMKTKKNQGEYLFIYYVQKWDSVFWIVKC